VRVLHMHIIFTKDGLARLYDLFQCVCERVCERECGWVLVSVYVCVSVCVCECVWV